MWKRIAEDIQHYTNITLCLLSNTMSKHAYRVWNMMQPILRKEKDLDFHII